MHYSICYCFKLILDNIFKKVQRKRLTSKVYYIENATKLYLFTIFLGRNKFDNINKKAAKLMFMYSNDVNVFP